MDKVKKLALIEAIKTKYISIVFCLNEMGRRLWAGAEAKTLGYGGIAIVVEATGMSNATVHKGLRELQNQEAIDKTRVRKKGGGRKGFKNTQVMQALDKLVEPTASGNPENPLKWTAKSLRNLAAELKDQGHNISFRSVSTLLKELGYSLQANMKTRDGTTHKDRDAQFNYINHTVGNAIKLGQPAISVDTKKKENIGNFKNNGREYVPSGKPVEVSMHDFPDKTLGKVVPYGVYDIGQNKGWVSVGISSDTAQFAVNSIRTWWHSMGKGLYKSPSEIFVTADCGGSNGYRVRLWKHELQKLSDELKLKITVCHFPPGTSKWNKIEHRLFSYISKNWRGRPLVTTETVINLIGSTTTNTGLKVMAVMDKNNYKTGIEISDKTFAEINISVSDFHPEWNYTISPRVV